MVLAITKSKGEYRQSIVVKMMNVLKIAGSVGNVQQNLFKSVVGITLPRK